VARAQPAREKSKGIALADRGTRLAEYVDGAMVK
jgi:hypothetical protein